MKKVRLLSFFVLIAAATMHGSVQVFNEQEYINLILESMALSELLEHEVQNSKPFNAQQNIDTSTKFDSDTFKQDIYTASQQTKQARQKEAAEHAAWMKANIEEIAPLDENVVPNSSIVPIKKTPQKRDLFQNQIKNAQEASNGKMIPAQYKNTNNNMLEPSNGQSMTENIKNVNPMLDQKASDVNTLANVPDSTLKIGSLSSVSHLAAMWEKIQSNQNNVPIN